VSQFHARRGLLEAGAGADDDSKVPTTGPIDRILASHYQFGQGLDPSKVCFDLAAGFSAGAKCVGRFVGSSSPTRCTCRTKKPQPARTDGG